jgi:hypothetical protein
VTIEPPDIPGAADVIAWFGYWPTFHDGEVLSVTLDRRNPSRVVVHAFESTPEVDSRGHYVSAKHAIVTFILSEVTNTRIEQFNHQNVLNGLFVKRTPAGYQLVLEGIHGLDGTIDAARMRVELTPGIPPGSMYAT